MSYSFPEWWPKKLPCTECGTDTTGHKTYYMLHDAVWDQLHPEELPDPYPARDIDAIPVLVGHGLRIGNLCWKCLHLRASARGLELKADHFTECALRVNEFIKATGNVPGSEWEGPIE